MAEHTPTPWHFDELTDRPDGLGYVRCETDNLEISHHGDRGRSRDENLANAAFIVKAVNNHVALVKALGDLLEYCDVDSDGETDWERTVTAAQKAFSDVGSVRF